MKHKMSVFATLTVILILIASLCSAKEMRPLDNKMIMLIKSVSGDKEEEMKNDAAKESVKECVGRIYFTKNIILARDILEKYLDQNYDKFIYSIEILKKGFASGKTILDLKIFVDYGKLVADLEEKKFLYEPKLRPFFYVFLEEKLDGQIASYSTGNTSVVNALKDLQQRTANIAAPSVPANVNIMSDRQVFAKAIEMAQKNEIELIITGTCETNKLEQKDLYYENYTFYESKISLKLIRVDTGEALVETETSGLATNLDAERAIELSIIRASLKASSEIIDYFKANWNPTILDKANYKIMFTGIQQSQLDVFSSTLLKLGDKTKMYLRSYYHNVAVINLMFKGDKAELLRFLETFPYPTFKIVSIKDNNIEVSVRE